MSITRSGLSDLNENTLRIEILIPLFKAMGFQDVTDFHGGVLEHGKDIVMWKAGEFRSRVNYGVVIKATKISGRTTGQSSAAEVRFQIEQCITTPFQDPSTGEELNIHRCIVVSSKKINKEAIAALRGVLASSGWDKITEFIDGDRLWDLIDEYLPKRAVLEKLNQVDKVLGQASPNYRINARTSAEGIELTIEPKSEVCREEPLEFNICLNLPSNSEGLRMQEALKQHFETGAPVTIKKPFIEYVSMPEFLQPFMPPEGKFEQVVIGSSRSLGLLL